MSFSVSLSPDLVVIEPGATTPVSIVINNRGPEADRYELDLEGIDAEWKAIPVPVFGVDAGETHSEKVFIKPPRTSESHAGNYPFVVRVRSLVSGEQRTVQGVAQIKAFHHVSMEVSPRKGSISPIRKNNTFGVTLVNLGNTDHTINVVGTDPEDACTYEFEAEQISLGPGQQREMDLTVVPTTSRIIAGSRLIGFTVTGRSVDTPSVAASAQAQLEQRPLFTPAAVAVLTVFLALFGLWFAMLPKPPSIDLSANPKKIVAGEAVTLRWAAENARHVLIKAGDQTIYDGPDLNGNQTVTLTTPGLVTIRAEASYHEQRKTTTMQIDVEPAPTVPAPTIDELSVDRTTIKLGEPFVLHYKVGPSVTSLVLQPSGLDLDPALDEREIVPSRSGKLEYTLVARNSANQQVEKAFTVNVVDESDARIQFFTSSAKKVTQDDPHIVLNWKVYSAEGVEVGPAGQTPTSVDPAGSMEFTLSAKTTFILTAFDAKGRKTTQSIVVDFAALPANPLPEGPQPTPTTGTTQPPTTGGTTGTDGGVPPPGPPTLPTNP